MARELSVGEVATRSGVAVSALRFYERKGSDQQQTARAAISDGTRVTSCVGSP